MKYRTVDFKPITDEQIKVIIESHDNVDSDGLRDALDSAAEQFIHNHYDQQLFPHADLEKRLGNIVSTAKRLQVLLGSDSHTDRHCNNILNSASRLHYLLTIKTSDSFVLESILNHGQTEKQNGRRESLNGNLALLIENVALLKTVADDNTNNKGNSSTEISDLSDQIELLRRVAFHAGIVQKNQKAKSKSVNKGDQAFNDLFLGLYLAYSTYCKKYPSFMIGDGDPRGQFATFIGATLEAIRFNLSNCVKESDPAIVFSLPKSPEAIRAQWRRTEPEFTSS